MFIELPTAWLVAINVVAWLVIHLGVAWLGTKIPVRPFHPDRWPYRDWAWEGNGTVYEQGFRIKAWKDRLPDGAALFAGGFRKANLRATSPEYLERFVKETCRGEAVHWIVLLASLLFFLWNPWWAGLIMVAYALVANVPCILVQRYNRIRLKRLCRGRGGRPHR
jgi:glycosyl-4,4'-diaponeurosporenoate acyltransferase